MNFVITFSRKDALLNLFDLLGDDVTVYVYLTTYITTCVCVLEIMRCVKNLFMLNLKWGIKFQSGVAFSSASNSPTQSSIITMQIIN